MILRLLILLVLMGCEERIAMVSSSCNLPCYAGRDGTAGVAHCSMGVTACNEEGVVTHCEGEVLPGSEVCNNKDDDCDGEIDNRLTDDWVGTPCGNDVGICTAGREACVLGESQCVGEEFGSPEMCNNLDDDCNGLVDDDLELEFCYTADPATLAHGECRAGINECIEGEYICMYQRVPTTEICNGLDDDCDGFIDEDLYSSTDIFFMVDTSGSMGSSINNSVSAAHRTAVRLADTDTMYGAAEIPGERSGGTWDAMRVVTDLTDSVTFQSLVVNIGSGSGGFEPTIDAIYEACLGTALSWRQDASRALIVFSDELPQTGTNRTAQEAIDACTTAGIVLYAFTEPNAYVEYESMTTSTGGQTFFLGHSTWMMEDLNTIFSEDCN